jgi:glycosyltransferase involved in cell wall biosynthesis
MKCHENSPGRLVASRQCLSDPSARTAQKPRTGRPLTERRLRVSLILPNFNHQAYLPASLGALLGQTRPADEIIIIDDASTDASVTVIEALIAGRADVRLIRNAQNGGVVAALNAGLALATGDLVAFLGADDRVYPNFIEVLAPMLEASTEAAFASARVEIHDQHDCRTGERPIVRPCGTARNIPPIEARRQLEGADNFFLGAVTLYRRARVLELAGFDATLGSLSDGILQRRMAVRWGYAFVPSLLGVWRVHGTNYSVASVTEPATLERLIGISRDILASEPPDLFPAGYPEKFERRLRFNAARLLVGDVGEQAEAPQRIRWTIRGTALDQRVLAACSRLAGSTGGMRPGRWLAMAWLTLRLRPISPRWLIREAFWRLRSKKNPP